MAEAESHEAGGEHHADTKKDKRNRQLTVAAVAVGIVGAVFAWLSFRRGSGGGTASYTYPTVAPQSGTLASSGPTGQQAVQAQGQGDLISFFGNQFDTLWNQNNDLRNSLFDLSNRVAAIPAGAGVGNGVTPGEQNTGGAPSQLGALPPSSPFGAPNLPGAAPTPGYGNTAQPDPASWAPTTVASGSIMAPPGGVLAWGTWAGDKLVSGTYQLPNGQFQSVG